MGAFAPDIDLANVICLCTIGRPYADSKSFSSYLESGKQKKNQHPPADTFHPGLTAPQIQYAALVPLTEVESSRISANSDTLDFHQGTALGSIHDPKPLLEGGNASDSIALDMEKLTLAETDYSFGDLFCGGCGASWAGEKVFHHRWGLDKNKAACETLRLNFEDAVCFERDARDFDSIGSEQVKVDVLHMSPPCQYFSIAHSIPGPNDKANIEASMIIGDWLDKAKPRIVTLENVDGLMSRTKGTGGNLSPRDYWDHILQQFNSRGFSISWKFVRFEDYGLPQHRKRVIVIACWYVTPMKLKPYPLTDKAQEKRFHLFRCRRIRLTPRIQAFFHM